MMTVKEIIDRINSDAIYGVCRAEDAVNMGGSAEVATIDHDEHRWYVVATVVYKLGDQCFGVRGVVSLKSEEMGFEDTYEKCEAFEMEEVPSVTYKRTTPSGE